MNYEHAFYVTDMNNWIKYDIVIWLSLSLKNVQKV